MTPIPQTIPNSTIKTQSQQNVAIISNEDKAKLLRVKSATWAVFLIIAIFLIIAYKLKFWAGLGLIILAGFLSSATTLALVKINPKEPTHSQWEH